MAIRECGICCEEIADEEEMAEVHVPSQPGSGSFLIHVDCYRRDLVEVS